jgi:hypothetical protein
MQRRSVAIGGGAAALALAAGTLADARFVQPYRPGLTRVDLRLPPGHDGLAGLTIGFVTDTHVCRAFSADHLSRATALVAEARPDLVLFGGDYVSGSPRFIPAAARALGLLARAAPLGGVAVLGNHDHSVGADDVERALTVKGVTVLRNSAVAVDRGGYRLWVAGVEDSLLGRPDLPQTFANIPPRSAALAVWHEAEFAKQAAACGAFAQLSGHTHGGQVRFPLVGALPLALPPHGRRHVMGLNIAAGMPVYTSRGVGVYQPPIRFNCPPEVVLVTLRSPEGTDCRPTGG